MFVGIAAGVVLTSLVIQRILTQVRARRVMRHYFSTVDAERESQATGWQGIGQVRGSVINRLTEELDDAGIRVPPTTWIALWAASAVLGGILFGALRWWLLLPGIAVGAFIPWYVVRARIAANQRRFESELPDFLSLVASGLRSGLSFGQAVGGAAVSGSDSLARQMRRVTAEVSVGVDLAEALDHVAERMDSKDLRWTVQALRVQGEVGGSLSRILDIAAKAVRQRSQLHREVRTLSAEGRLSAIILMILPVAIFIFFLIIRPDYIAVLWTSTVGWLLLGVLFVLLALGALWMRRIVEIRV
jgi:tight adherence protein B